MQPFVARLQFGIGDNRAKIANNRLVVLIIRMLERERAISGIRSHPSLLLYLSPLGWFADERSLNSGATITAAGEISGVFN